MQLRFLACSLLALSLASTSLIGCAAAADGVVEVEVVGDAVTDPKTATLDGTWTSSDGTPHPASIHLEQHGLHVSVTLHLEGHSCLSSSSVEASLSSSGLDIEENIAGMHLVLGGNPSLDDLAGDFDALEAGPCEKGSLAVSL